MGFGQARAEAVEHPADREFFVEAWDDDRHPPIAGRAHLLYLYGIRRPRATSAPPELRGYCLAVAGRTSKTVNPPAVWIGARQWPAKRCNARSRSGARSTPRTA